MPQYIHIFGSIPRSHSAFIFAKSYIQYPVQAVLYCPVRSSFLLICHAFTALLVLLPLDPRQENDYNTTEVPQTGSGGILWEGLRFQSFV
jgi:hypothetical protein